MFDSLYTDEVKKIIYNTKPSLPKDFPLITVERELYDSGTYDSIIIQVPASEYDWRSVEEKTRIYYTLLGMKQLISEEGVLCLIEKTASTE